jgi:DNA repair exonuclease SbcCD ATPase subunit
MQGQKDELEKVKRELRFAKEKAEDLERTKASEMSAMLAKYNREMADLEEALHVLVPACMLVDAVGKDQGFR